MIYLRGIVAFGLWVYFFSSIFSCSYIIPSKKSQLGYQSYDYWELDTIKLEKFNPAHLKTLVRSQHKKDLIIFQHYNSCGYTISLNEKLAEQSKGFSNLILVPVVHDYLYNFQKSIQHPYGWAQTLYYTDKKLYGKTLNPINSWYKDVLSQFYTKQNIDSNDGNFYFNDSLSGCRIFFYHRKVDSLKYLFDSANQISYRLD
jgi:hypothetical protein